MTAMMREFHDTDYIEFLRRVTPDVPPHRPLPLACLMMHVQAINDSQMLPEFQRFNVGDDCPIFDKLFDYCQSYTGGSVQAAHRINHGLSDIAINWSGGLHHAHKSQVAASSLALCDGLR